MFKKIFRFVFLCNLIFLSDNLASQILPPYQNNFDSFDSTGWSHYSITGTDDWTLTAPAKTYFNGANTFPNGWVTNIIGNFNGNSNRALQTPCFDLTDTTQKLIFSFYHKTHANSSGNAFIVEYSLNNGTTWSVLTNTASPSTMWQSATGFSGNLYSSFYKSTFGLRFLQGNPSVCFRFRFNSTTANGEGWLVDDFAIEPEYYNVKALKGDTIKNLNHFFTQFPINFKFQFDNQFYSSFNFSNNFYFSRDSIKDIGDVFLGNKSLNTTSTVTNWANTFQLPSGLNAGYYYILYDLDANNILNEANESDNSNFTILKIDSIYVTDYIDNFDSLSNDWSHYTLGYNPTYNLSWRKSPPNYFRMERAHSGKNAYHTVLQSTTPNPAYTTLQSPFLDLSTKTNQAICFWYRITIGQVGGSGNMNILIPPSQSFKTTTPYYTTNISIKNPKNTNWDCFCYKLSNSFDSIVSTKFGIQASGLEVQAGSSSYSRNAIDDIYIGEIKPDVSVDFKDEKYYTNSNISSDTLSYYLFNSGLSILPSTTSNFYWSNDSVWDTSDILITTINEPPVTDTTFIKRKITIIKPVLTAGNYYIIYKLDANSTVNEMREYNNQGFLKVIQNNPENLPYFNDFETNTNNWSHYSSLGTDDWVCATPTKTNITSAFSGLKGWVTSATSVPSQNSKMHLCTPIYNLSQLNNPVMEFDMKYTPYYVNNYNLWPYNGLNMSYSIDGGFTWTVLDTTNKSFARWFYRFDYDLGMGKDFNPTAVANGFVQSYIIGENREKVFQAFHEYQSRDGLNTSHYVIDLNFLKSHKKILFRFNYANMNAPVDGALIDNFSITESTIDLAINNRKNLQTAPSDKFISTFFDVNNNGNYISPQTDLKLYLSVDSILDAGDYLFRTVTVGKIRPQMKNFINFKGNTTALSLGVKYMIYQLDSQNLIAETDESNNIGYFPLDNNSARQLPYFNDFNASEIDGWSFYKDSLPNTYNFEQRFRHKVVIQERSFMASNGEWFLDLITNSPNFNFANLFPIYYLVSPTFDFSDGNTYKLDFDFKCMGTNHWSYSSGGNLQYSTDGGINWIVISEAQDPAAVNLYPSFYYLQSLNNQPGWNIGGFAGPASINLSFLNGYPNVKFRFAYKSNYIPGTLGISEHGFRMDNFNISSLLPTAVANASKTSNSFIKYLNHNTFELSGIDDCTKAEIKVFDLQGKMVSNESTSLCLGKVNAKIDLSYCKPGMYLVHLTEKDLTKTYKVIVN